MKLYYNALIRQPPIRLKKSVKSKDSERTEDSNKITELSNVKSIVFIYNMLIKSILVIEIASSIWQLTLYQSKILGSLSVLFRMIKDWKGQQR